MNNNENEKDQRRSIAAVVLSPGTTFGNACLVQMGTFKQNIHDDHKKNIDVEHEVARFNEEKRKVISDLAFAVSLLEEEGYSQEAEIIGSHLAILQDLHFINSIEEKIRKNKITAETALDHVIKETAEFFENADNFVFSEKSKDFKDIGLRLEKQLRKDTVDRYHKLLNNTENPIVIIRELLPSMILEAQQQNIRGFVIEEGSVLSHATILARSFEIPVFKISSISRLHFHDNIPILLDSDIHQIILYPDESDLIEIETTQLRPKVSKQDITQELPLKIFLNVMSPHQISSKTLSQTSGIGLFRSEFLFIAERDTFPTEQEQFEIYRLLFKSGYSAPITLRTLDIGADKMLPYFPLGKQENPYLGLRAHRIYRFHPDVFLTQVRAILRAAEGKNNLYLMYPMIETVDDLLFVQKLLNQAIQSLDKDRIPRVQTFQQGVLIEVPSAIWNLQHILNYVDFCSIGTNDLLQYFFAVDRNNNNVGESYRPLSPSVISMLDYVVNITRTHRKPLSICGELASESGFLPILVGLGFDSISVAPKTLNKTKETLKKLTSRECQNLVRRCLSFSTASECRKELELFCADHNIAFSLGENNKPVAVDPVCGMEVHPEDIHIHEYTYQGKEYYFCSMRCFSKFIQQLKM